MSAETISLILGGLVVYYFASAFAGMLPIKSNGLRAVAMVFWPVALLVALLALPFMVWNAAREDQ